MPPKDQAGWASLVIATAFWATVAASAAFGATAGPEVRKDPKDQTVRVPFECIMNVGEIVDRVDRFGPVMVTEAGAQALIDTCMYRWK